MYIEQSWYSRVVPAGELFRGFAEAAVRLGDVAVGLTDDFGEDFECGKSAQDRRLGEFAYLEVTRAPKCQGMGTIPSGSLLAS